MNKKKPKYTLQDMLWKGIVEDLIEYIIGFFFGKWAHEIDFSKGVTFLDKELAEITADLGKGQRYVDKLVQVYTKNGKPKWFLIHIEVQGYTDPDFAKRMFIYFYRILDRYEMPVTALAIFTDDNMQFHPKSYGISHFGTRNVYEFNTYKLLEKQPEDFHGVENPIAVVMETAWYGIKKNRKNRRLMEKGYPRELIEVLLNFIKRYIRFEKPQKKLTFEKKLDVYLGKKKTMGVKDAIIQFYSEQAADEREEKVTKEVTEKVTKEVTEKVTEEVTEKVTEKVTQNLTQKYIIHMRENGLKDKEIAGLMGISIEEIRAIFKGHSSE